MRMAGSRKFNALCFSESYSCLACCETLIVILFRLNMMKGAAVAHDR
jgi:hypothetical protein